MLEKDGPKINVRGALRMRSGVSLDPSVKTMNINNAVRTAAAPYEVVIQEQMSTYDIKITLVDTRRETPSRVVVKIPREVTERDGGNIDHVIMRAVEQAKARLQNRLSKDCDEPEIRRWAAEHRGVDLMDNGVIPSRIRIEYRKQNAVVEENERLSRQESDRVVPKATEHSIESDNGPVRDTPPPRLRRIKRRPRITITGEDRASAKLEVLAENIHGEPTAPIILDEVKPNVPVAKVKGAHSKTAVRKPRCKNREHDEMPEMVYEPEEGVWKCPEGCGAIARPKSDSPVGHIQLGKGRLDFRVLFVEPGKKPSILLVADNNIALDVTDYVDMDNFLKYSSAVRRAQLASNKGEENVEVKLGVDSNGAERDVTALLRFPGMRIYGCDNA